MKNFGIKYLNKTKRSNIAKIMFFLLALIFIVHTSIFWDTNKDNELKKNAPHSTQSIQIPKKLEFAGEKVPVENFDIYESLDRELSINVFWHSQTILFIKRANRFFSIIEPILKKNNIPDDFKYLAVAESGLMNAVSPSGAKGYWQFLEPTAKECGLEINDEIDERYNLEKSTEAACKFLNKSYKKYNNWTLAAASYNFGRKNLNKQITRQKSDNYFNLLLGEETGRYVFRIIAIKMILSNPQNYGFNINKKDLYPIIPTYKVTIDSSVTNFAQFAKDFSINYKILKIFNPWLRENYLSNKNKKTYEIVIPKKGYRTFKN
ncbi:MAG: transglycosylase SLT domain-containing protein [Bacteroidales bacterium]|nr:transglycosylase SLT domain-containing protein [Bacteroidales bacterium]